jgi:hypothetical protein
LSCAAGPDKWLHIAAAVLTHASLLENPLGTVRAFAFLADLPGKASAVAGTELNVIGVGLLANGAGFHVRRCNHPSARILAEALPQWETGLKSGVRDIKVKAEARWQGTRPVLNRVQDGHATSLGPGILSVLGVSTFRNLVGAVLGARCHSVFHLRF